MAIESTSPSILYIATILTLLVTSIGVFVSRLYHARMLVVERQRMGLPIAPGHGFVFGHLLYLKTKIDALPKGAHYEYAFGDVARQHFTKEGVFYIDLWPLSGLFLTVVSPKVAIQAAQTNSDLSSERPALLSRFFKPIAGGPNLFDLPEREWKPWRATFNKGFSTDHILSLVPGIAQETGVYCNTLRKLAKAGGLVYLDPVTLRFTMDLIGRTILNTSLGAQSGPNTLADCMLSQIRWHQPNAETNPFEYLKFARWYMHWWNGWQMDQYIGGELDKRYKEYRADPTDKRGKSVIDLVLQTHLQGDTDANRNELDKGFRIFAIRQIRLFVFAGHDSTSSTICYIFYLLSANLEALSLLRAKYDKVLGTDTAAAASLLESCPQLTESLTYTLAVVKEALRLFTPAGSSRRGKRNVNVLDHEDNVCPTDDAMIWTVHVEMHRSPKYWKRADEFLPERWTVEPGHELYPMKGAWRSFEHGPRNCIAQGLVLTELRVVLALTARNFDIKPAYDEYDQLHPRKGLRTYRGERVYQIEEGAAHPVDKYPCRIHLRKN